MSHVFIGIPNTGTVARGLAQNLCYWVGLPGVRVSPFVSNFNLPMMFHRNMIVLEFLKTDCDYLWWIDDDVVPPASALEKMLAHNVDAVTAVAFSTRSDGKILFPYPVTLKEAPNGEYSMHYAERFEEVDACGGACLLVKREVYEHPALKAPYQHWMNEDGSLGMTCDFTFWRRAKAQGFKLFVDPTLHCSHFKDIDIREFNNSLVEAANGRFV